MKTKLHPLLLALCTMAMLAGLAQAEEVHIKVRSAKVKATPQYWAPAVGTLKYGDTLEQLSMEGGWLKVKFSGKTGYLHESAVTTKKVIIQSNAKGTSNTNISEVVLAGKGFSKATERQVALTDGTLNFKAVDAMERIKVSEAAIGEFIRAGKLNSKG